MENNSQRRWGRKLPLLPAFAGISIVCAVCLSLILTAALIRRSRTVAAGRRASIARNAALPRFSPSRPVYPYSVIRGGAYSADELFSALHRDSVAARHYLVFRRARVHMVDSHFSEPVFLSYRIGDAIYWTSRTVRLPRGETLLTDGTNYARARCGNRISVTAQMPVSETEPAPLTLDEPQPLSPLDTWSKNQLIMELANPIAQNLPLRTMPINTLPAVGPEIAPPSWWTILPPPGILYPWEPIGLSPNVPPRNLPPGPVIANPFPGLTSPPTPVSGFPPVYAIPPEVPPSFTVPPTSPVAIIQPVVFPPGTWPPAPIIPLVPGTPGVPGGPGTPGGPVGPSTPPNSPMQPVPEPSMLAPTFLALSAIAVVRFRRRRTVKRSGPTPRSPGLT